MIDLNSDVGEAWGVFPAPQQVWRAEWERGDTEPASEQPLTGSTITGVLRQLSSVNLACGMHAGDPLSIQKYLAQCVSLGLGIGAHPSYPDLLGFGNRSMALPPQELVAVIQYQLAALDGLTRLAGGALQHVKLHGALYHDAGQDPDVATSVVKAVQEYNPSLLIYGMPDTPLHKETERAGLKFIREGFPDRTYLPSGRLKPRSLPGALITQPNDIAAQGASLARGTVLAEGGVQIEVQIDTLCLHIDTPGVPQGLALLREQLINGGTPIRRPSGM